MGYLTIKRLPPNSLKNFDDWAAILEVGLRSGRAQAVRGTDRGSTPAQGRSSILFPLDSKGECQVFCVNDLDFVVALGFGFGFGFVVALGFCVVVGFGDGVQGKGAIGVHPKSETGD